MRLPHGPVTKWNMELLSDEVLQHEYDLCYEVLNDIIIDGEVRIIGMLKNPDLENEMGRAAINVWKTRLMRAETEIERRFLLS